MYPQRMRQTETAPPISLRRRRAITAGLLLGMSLGALEATVVGTAMPTVIATLGGLAHYSWVFSAYLLTSTASVPIWGRLSDLYGRRRMYLTGIAIFLVGSMLSGAATSMTTLIAARAFQGLGAGRDHPAQHDDHRRALHARGTRAHPGALQRRLGRGVGRRSARRRVHHRRPLLALGVLSQPAVRPAGRRCSCWRIRRHAAPTTVRVDWLGAALLFAGISALLLALGGDTGAAAWWFAGAAVVLLAAFVVVERRSPTRSCRSTCCSNPLIARTLVVVFLVGMALFGAIAFIPLFVQGVMGATATQAGQVLTPLFLGWVVMSIAARPADREARLPAARASAEPADDARIRRTDAGRRRLAAQLRARRRPAHRLRAWGSRCCRCCWPFSTASIERISGSRPR